MDVIVLQAIAPNNEPSWTLGGRRIFSLSNNECMVIGVDRQIYHAVKVPSSLLYVNFKCLSCRLSYRF